ncbi:MAG TPA: hypothetical protein PKC24_01325, partial [Cyclobacteriaceae bacterium]|nr:hypothetical protein [Cyclobacteriaceae bacterium]
AFNDINKNLKVDSKNEAYGFLSDTLKLFRNYDSVALGLFKLDARILKVNSARQTGTFFATKLSKGITEYAIDFDGLDSLYVHHLAESNSAIRIYPYDKVTDSVKFRLYAKDSIGFKIDTVLYYKVDFESRRIPENWELKTEASNIFVERRILQKKFSSSKPIIKLNIDSIYLFIDSTRTLTFNKEYLKLDTADNSVLFRVELDKADVDSLLRGPKADPRAARGESLKQVNPFLYFGKGALISIEKDSSKVYKENPKQISYTNTGTIITEVQSTSKSYIIQVIDNRNRLIAEERNNPKAIFRYLNPGDYRIRVLIDQNENGKWDMGNYFKNEIPEPVYIYKNSEGSETIKLLANWEIGPLVLTF